MAKLTEEQVKELLYKENPTFKELKDKHSKLDMQIQEIDKKGKLSAEDEFELAKLKKSKLALKDKMYALIREYKNTHNE